MDIAQFLVSLVGGGLAGGGVSTISNRLLHYRSLRTQFEPKVSSMLAAYAIRLETPQGRFLIRIAGKNPSTEDTGFVDHRSNFVLDLVQFNELREVRVLRKKMLSNSQGYGLIEAIHFKTDLTPERNALVECLIIVQGKLGLSK